MKRHIRFIDAKKAHSHIKAFLNSLPIDPEKYAGSLNVLLDFINQYDDTIRLVGLYQQQVGPFDSKLSWEENNKLWEERKLEINELEKEIFNEEKVKEIIK